MYLLYFIQKKQISFACEDSCDKNLWDKSYKYATHETKLYSNIALEEKAMSFIAKGYTKPLTDDTITDDEVLR